MSTDSELLTGLSDGELDALADSMLAPSAQARLDELLARTALGQVNQPTILKTRAKYTLHQAAATRT